MICALGGQRSNPSKDISSLRELHLEISRSAEDERARAIRAVLGDQYEFESSPRCWNYWRLMRDSSALLEHLHISICWYTENDDNTLPRLTAVRVGYRFHAYLSFQITSSSRHLTKSSRGYLLLPLSRGRKARNSRLWLVVCLETSCGFILILEMNTVITLEYDIQESHYI